MAEATARVAGLLATTKATAKSTTTTTTVATTALGAAACNVSNPAALVAFLTTASGRATGVTFSLLGAFARDVTNTTATVAGLLLGSYSALSAYRKKKSRSVNHYGTNGAGGPFGEQLTDMALSYKSAKGIIKKRIINKQWSWGFSSYHRSCSCCKYVS